MEIVKHILTDGKDTPKNVWKPVWDQLCQQISSSLQPLGHGTRTDKLESILTHGLDQSFASSTTHPDFEGKSFCFALDTEDGLTGAQIFALMLDAPVDLTASLAIRADMEKGESFEERYSRLNSNFATPEAQARLKMAVAHYCQFHGAPKGVPILLIFDGRDEIETVFQVSGTPSEAHLLSVLRKEHLQAILVPANDVRQIQNEFALDVPIYPLELLELAELAGLTGSHYKR